MRVRTFLGTLLALVVVVVASYLTHLNIELLTGRFALSERTTMPVYAAILAAFLLGFLPAVSVLLAQTLRRDLAQRRTRQLDREKRSADANFRRGVDLVADDQWAAAAEVLEGVLAERPEDFSALLHYGEALRRLGRHDEALEVHRRTSVLYPRSVATLYQLAQGYAAAGQPEVAEQVHDRILRDFPEVALQVLRNQRARALEAADWQRAEELQSRIEVLGPPADAAEKALALGIAYQRAVEQLQRDRYDDARSSLIELEKEEPRFIPALILRGEVERLAGADGEAVAAWRRGFASTGSPVFLQRIEDYFIARERPMEAIETLHEIIAEADPDVLPRFFLGRLFYRLEMHEEALRVLADLAEQVSSSPSYHYLLGRIYQRQGALERAVREFHACIQHAGLDAAEYLCRVCDKGYTDWRDRCERCGSWNAVELNLTVEKFSAEELGLQQAPVYAAYTREA